METQEKLIERIKYLDRANWSQPSNYRAIEIMKLEAQFEHMFGIKCPEWPHRALAK